MEEIKITPEESDMLLHGREHKPGEEGELTDTGERITFPMSEAALSSIEEGRRLAAEREAARATENVSNLDTNGGGEAIALTEQEAHCIARLLQGAVYGEGLFDGCAFCKFQCNTDRNAGEVLPRFDEIRMKLWEATGVDLAPCFSGEYLLHSKFKYKKFLKNSNEDIKEYFRNFFRDI